MLSANPEKKTKTDVQAEEVRYRVQQQNLQTDEDILATKQSAWQNKKPNRQQRTHTTHTNVVLFLTTAVNIVEAFLLLRPLVPTTMQ